MSNIRYLSWAAMVLDENARVRADGFGRAPADLSDAAAEALTRALATEGAVRDDAIEFLESHADPRARDLLVQAMAAASSAYRARPFRSAVAGIDARRHSPDPAVVVPDLVPWPDLPAPDLWAERAYDLVQRMLGWQHASIQTSRRLLQERGEVLDEGPGTWYAQTRLDIARYGTVTMADCEEAARGLAGSGRVHPVLRDLADGRFDKELASGLSPMQRLRLTHDPRRPNLHLWAFDYRAVDLRHLADAARRLGVRRAASFVGLEYFREMSHLDGTLAWPFFVEHPGLLDAALGLAVPEARGDDGDLARALGVLADMPRLPRRYLPRVIEVATDGKARPRAAARRVVERHGDPASVARAGLGHGRAGVRASCAAWIVEIADPASCEALRSALAVEASASARRAMADALLALDRG